MKNNTIPQKPKPRRHKQLFDDEIMYQYKVQRDHIKYTRKIKHKVFI